MKMDSVHKSTGTILGTEEYKGSGTVLYRADDYILVLTAYHNLYGDSGSTTEHTTQMSLLEDNKEEKYADTADIPLVAEMVNGNYIQVGKKDIALVAMELKNKNNYFENNEVVHSILDFNSTQQPGQDNGIDAQINQYPTYFNWYIKTIGIVYHDSGIGYHLMPTLPGASGSAVVIDNNIIGVHVSSGKRVSPGVKNIRYRRRELLVENNIFELISIDH